MAKQKALVAQYDEAAAELVRSELEALGFEVELARTAGDISRMAKADAWQVIVLDLMLPDGDGFDVCRQIKWNQGTAEIPLIIVSEKGEDPDVIAALELGAEDYIVKPFSPRVFRSRIRAILRQSRRNAVQAPASIEMEGIVIHPGRHEVVIGRRQIGLTATEFKLLHLLSLHPGRVFRRHEILTSLRGSANVTSERAVDVQIAGLRRRLGTYGRRIETVRGVGYRLRAD